MLFRHKKPHDRVSYKSRVVAKFFLLQLLCCDRKIKMGLEKLVQSNIINIAILAKYFDIKVNLSKKLAKSRVKTVLFFLSISNEKDCFFIYNFLILTGVLVSSNVYLTFLSFHSKIKESKKERSGTVQINEI